MRGPFIHPQPGWLTKHSTDRKSGVLVWLCAPWLRAVATVRVIQLALNSDDTDGTGEKSGSRAGWKADCIPGGSGAGDYPVVLPNIAAPLPQDRQNPPEARPRTTPGHIIYRLILVCSTHKTTYHTTQNRRVGPKHTPQSAMRAENYCNCFVIFFCLWGGFRVPTPVRASILKQNERSIFLPFNFSSVQLFERSIF